MAKRPDTFVAFILFTVLFFMTPVSALLSAKLYSILWDILIKPQYGAGPSYQAWYGIACFVSLALMNVRKTEPDEDQNPYTAAIGDVIGTYFAIGLTIVIALFVRAVLGWP